MSALKTIMDFTGRLPRGKICHRLRTGNTGIHFKSLRYAVEIKGAD